VRTTRPVTQVTKQRALWTLCSSKSSWRAWRYFLVFPGDQGHICSTANSFQLRKPIQVTISYLFSYPCFRITTVSYLCRDEHQSIFNRYWLRRVTSKLRAQFPWLASSILIQPCSFLPVTVAEPSKACTVFARSEAGIMGSIPTQDMGVWCVCMFFCVCGVLCLGRGLATSWSPVQGVLPSVNDQESEKSALCSKSGSKPPSGGKRK
jgi:hypothetical protein